MPSVIYIFWDCIICLYIKSSIIINQLFPNFPESLKPDRCLCFPHDQLLLCRPKVFLTEPTK